MRRFRAAAGLAGLFMLGAGVAIAGPESGYRGGPGGAKERETVTAVPKCPVMGEPVNLAVSVATDDGPVFFCCKDCIPKYEANPEKYAAKVAAQRKALGDRPKVQVTCPVSGETVAPKVFIERDGEKVFFCCKGCINKFEQNPEKYKASLANSYTYQTRCPVEGEAIDPQTRTGSIYFCCKGCDTKFFKDLEKHRPKLEEQGYKFDADDMKHGAQTPETDRQHHEQGEEGHEGHGHS